MGTLLRLGGFQVLFMCFWLLIGLAGFVVFGCVTSQIARSKGRDATGWFFLGAFTGLFGLVAVLAMLPAEYYVEGSSRRQPLS